jgi:hypothetical protein
MKDFISCKPIFVLRNRVVAPCDRVIPSRNVEGTCCIHLQDYESIRNYMYNPVDESGTCRRNVGKEVPNDRAQQPSRPGSTTITRWIPQLTGIFLIATYLFLITLCSSFIVLLVRD